MNDSNQDLRVRMAAFDWLRTQVDLRGDVLPRELLSKGFSFEGTQVRLVGPQGIFKPRILTEIPLTITTTARGPYSDHFGEDQLLRYAYRGQDPNHHENARLRLAMKRRIPLIYFHGLVPSKYVAAWPVFIVGDDPRGLTFTVALDDALHVGADLEAVATHTAVEDSGADGRRSYITSTFKHRLHQRTFRERVLRAYHQQCSLCRLRHEELLDAAHIIADSEPDGEPVVTNGLALCKLHHAAYDRSFLAIRPNYVIEVRPSVLEEEDGPMLLHGLKGLHGQRIHLPRSKKDYPDSDRLETRYLEYAGSL